MLQSLLASGFDAFLVMDNETVIDANDETFSLFGIPKEQVIGSRFSGLFLDGQWGMTHEELSAVIAAAGIGEKRIAHKSFLLPDSSFRCVEISLRGAVLLGRRLVFASIRDITDQVHAEEALRSEKERLLSIIDTIPFAFWACDSSGTVIQQNARSVAEKGPLLGKNIFSAEGDGLSFMADDLHRAASGETVVRDRQRMRDGTEQYFYDIIAPMKTGDAVSGFMEIGIDVTEARLAKIELETKDRLLSGIIDTAPIGIMVFHGEKDPVTNDRRIIFLNGEFSRITGYTSDDITVGMDWWTKAYPDENYRLQRIAAFSEKLKEADAGKHAVGPIDARIRCRDGSFKDILCYYMRQREYSLFFLIDMTETQQIRRDLIESQRRLEQILRFLPDATFAIDLEGRIIFWNRAMEELTGISGSEMIGKGDHEYSWRFYGERRDMLIDFVLHPESPTAKIYTAMRREGDSVFAEFSRILADGTRQTLWGKASPLYDTDGNVIGTMESVRNITELRDNEEKLRQSESKFRTIFESMPLGFFRTKTDGLILEMNPALARIFGYASREEMFELLGGQSFITYENPEDSMSLLKRAESSDGEPVSYTSRLRKKDGSVFTANIIIRFVRNAEGQPLHLEGLIEDISERELLQQVMIQSEKMMTVAGLAAGMAHEINNPLGIILQMAENAERRLFGEIPGNTAAAEKAGISMGQLHEYIAERRIDSYLKGIREAGVRAARIVSNMLQFSRKSSEKMELNNVEVLLDRTVELVSNDYDLKKNYDFRQIAIVREYEGVPRVRCAEIQIEQVFLNILKNAAHAMADKQYSGGEKPSIHISTRRENGNAVIALADNGPGMDEEVRRKIFEPFFTTKAPGSGTGLGLSVSYFIISGHGGTISVSSEKGRGTCFTIRLPIAEGESIDADNTHS